MPEGLPGETVLGGYAQKNQLGTEKEGRLEPWGLFKRSESDSVYWQRTAQRIAFMLAGKDSVPIEGLEQKLFGYGNWAQGRILIQFSPLVSSQIEVTVADVDLSQPKGLSEAPEEFKRVLQYWLERYRGG